MCIYIFTYTLNKVFLLTLKKIMYISKYILYMHSVYVYITKAETVTPSTWKGWLTECYSIPGLLN